MELVDDVVPYEQRKLWLLNGSHSALAYGGLLAGCAHHRGSRRPRHRVAVRAVDSSTTSSASPSSPLRSGPPSSPPRCSVASATRPSDTRARRSAPTVRASCPNASDPSSPPESARGSTATRFATVAAIWVAAAAGLEVDGSKLPQVDEPEGARLRAAKGRDLDHLARIALRDTFDECFVATVAGALERLVREGMGLLEGPIVTETVGGAGSVLDEQRVRAFIREQLGRVELEGRSLCLVVPDATRNCPLRSILASVEPAVSDRVRSCTVVVALGTHAPMSPEAINAMVGPTQLSGREPRVVARGDVRLRRDPGRRGGGGALRGPPARELSTSVSTGSSPRAT